MIRPIETLHVLSSIPQARHYFLNGGCWHLFTILRRMYPEAVPYWNIDHVITRIEDKYYDITGIVRPKGYTSMTLEAPTCRKAHRWQQDFERRLERLNGRLVDICYDLKSRDGENAPEYLDEVIEQLERRRDVRLDDVAKEVPLP